MLISRWKPEIRPTLRPASPLPELLPFVNLFFLLLIFFVMSSTFVSISAIPVNLPESPQAGVYSIKKYIVTVDKSGKIYFNDTIVPDLTALKGKLLSDVVVTSSGERKEAIILRADAGTDFGKIAPIMALAEELHIHVFLLTRRSTAETEKTVFSD